MSHCSNNRNKGQSASRHTCLKRGIQIGLSQPRDADYDLEYDAIDPTKIYCGDGNRTPIGTRLGYSHECLRKGVGVGKKMKASYPQQSPWLIFIVACVVLISIVFK